MSEMKKQKLILPAVLALLCTGCGGCSEQKQNSEGRKPSATENIAIENIIAENPAAENFAVENAKREGEWAEISFSTDYHTAQIASYGGIYQEEQREVKDRKDSRFHFENCSFDEWNDIEDIYALEFEEKEISAEGSVEMVRSWLESINLQEKIDIKKELRDASGQLEGDESKEYPYEYPGVYENLDKLKSGSGFFINTNICYVQMCNYGYMQMSDGKINAYLGSERLDGGNAFGPDQEEVVEQGSVEELKDAVYPLLDGDMSVSVGADLAIQYFEKGAPNPPADGISVGTDEVSVFKLKDKFGMAFHMYRSYKGIRITNAMHGSRSDSSIRIEEDEKTACIVDRAGVTAFAGYCDAQPLIELGKSDEFIGLKEAVFALDDQLARNVTLDIEEAGFVYCPLLISEGYKVARPCWMFDGVNTVNGRNIVIYVDSISGSLYYYEYH